MSIFHKTALFIGAYQLISLFNHIASAFRTLLFGRLLPGNEITFRIALAAVKFSSFFGLFDDHFFSAFGTGDAVFSKYGFVLRHSGKPGQQELSMGAVFDDHAPSAELAQLIGLLIGNMDGFQGLLCFLNCFAEIRIKVSYNGLPVGASLPHAVQEEFRFAVKVRSTMLGKHCFMIRFTTSPSSVT